MSAIVLENTRILSATMQSRECEFEMAVKMECDFRGDICGLFELTGAPGVHLMSGRLDGEMRRVILRCVPCASEMAAETFGFVARSIGGFALRAVVEGETKRVTGHRLRFEATSAEPAVSWAVANWLNVMGRAAACVGLEHQQQSEIPLDAAAEWRTEDEIAAGVPR